MGDNDIQTGVDGKTKGVAICHACGNRIVTSDYSRFDAGLACRQLNPGVSGICNSLDGPVPAEARADLKAAAQPYLNGDYDGVLYRGSDGYCYRCDDKATHNSSVVQCASCGNRRNDGGCAYGGCTEGTTFMDINNACMSCGVTNMIQIPSTPQAQNLCLSCGNKRVLTKGWEADDNLTHACAQICEAGKFQSSDGVCYSCDYSNRLQIGTDSTSVSMCTDCGRVAFRFGTNQMMCSSRPTPGKEFVNFNGWLSRCTDNNVKIPDTPEARDLCLQCPKREVVEMEDGSVSCNRI